MTDDWEATRKYAAYLRLRELGIVPLGREFKYNTDTLLEMVELLEREEALI